MDENMISVPCSIEACNARVYGSTRCHEHGGDPDYEWRDSIWGTREYLRPDHRPALPSTVQLEGHNA